MSLCVASIYTTLFLSAGAPITVGCVTVVLLGVDSPGWNYFLSAVWKCSHVHRSDIKDSNRFLRSADRR